MTTTYKKYLNLNIDGALVGFGLGERISDYFCTPEHATVIGWAGVDGVHYCFVDGFGEMVFAVIPMNTPRDYVHPVARNFDDFLRLLLACGDAAPFDQASRWNQEQFDAFLLENQPTTQQQGVLDVIREQLSLTPMEHPFAYLKGLQGEFDYSALQYGEAYAEIFPAEPEMPEWRVSFDGNFWSHPDQEQAGEEIPINKQFVWENEDEVWSVPSIYSCTEGLVVDFCVRVPPAPIRAFMDKWNLSLENDGSDFDDEKRMEVDGDNPQSAGANFSVVLNGTVLRESHGSGLTWNPCIADVNNPTAESVLRHYGLDPAYGWSIQRAAFPWATKQKPQIRTLGVVLMQSPVDMAGPHFHISAPGESIQFTQPLTGIQHTLTVQEYERQELSDSQFDNPDMEFPTHYTMMGYTLTPDLPDDTCRIMDCIPSDQPRQKHPDPNEFFTVCFGMIADGPTAVLFGGSEQGKPRTAFSAVHFEPVEDVEWRMVFRGKTREDITAELI